MYVDTVYGFYWGRGRGGRGGGGGGGVMLSWMFQHDYLDTYCFECLICMRSVFLYLHLFSAIEHVSHGKAL